MLQLIRVLIFGLVFTSITLLSAVRGVVHPRGVGGYVHCVAVMP